MRALSTITLLEIWERGRRRSSAHRAIMLLAAACPDSSIDELRALPLGDRDGRLLHLREWAFGAEMRGLVNCPVCGETVEMLLHTGQLSKGGTESSFEVAICGERYRVRVPSTDDLLAVEDVSDYEAARRSLLERCIVDGDVSELSPAAAAMVANRMGECDPRANIELALECPGCCHRWLALFDTVSFFWREIEAWSRRALRDVHGLASAYGWSEHEILTLSPWRRSAYLEMAGQ